MIPYYRTELINYFIEKYGYKSYLEIGLDNPEVNYTKVNCDNKESIDPYQGGNGYVPNNLPDVVIQNLTYRMTSDDAFAQMPISKKYDIIFIDGLHESKQVAKDIINSLRHLNKGGKILLHDCLPWNEEVSVPLSPGKVPNEWLGDVYKTIMQLFKICPVFYTYDTDYGICIIEYFDGCNNLTIDDFKIEDISYDYYMKNHYWVMRVIGYDDFNAIYGDKRQDAKIFEIGHKKWESTNNKLVTPLQVGTYFSPKFLLGFKDSWGDSISHFNPLFGELSGIYWIWKNALNDENIKYVGQTGYRRKFLLTEDFDFDNVFIERKYDAIVGDELYLNLNLKMQYAVWHNLDDLNDIEKIIFDYYPEYGDAFEELFAGKTLYNANGFILKKEDYKKMCEFVFGVMFKWMGIHKFENIDDVKNYVERCFEKGVYKQWDKDTKEQCLKYQIRILGFIGERLTNVFIKKNFSKIYRVAYDPNTGIY